MSFIEAQATIEAATPFASGVFSGPIIIVGAIVAAAIVASILHRQF